MKHRVQLRMMLPAEKARIFAKGAGGTLVVVAVQQSIMQRPHKNGPHDTAVQSIQFLFQGGYFSVSLHDSFISCSQKAVGKTTDQKNYDLFFGDGALRSEKGKTWEAEGGKGGGNSSSRHNSISCFLRPVFFRMSAAARSALSYDYAAAAANVSGGNANVHQVPTFAHMMCELHVAQTLLLCPPFSFTITGFDGALINKELYSKLSRSPDALQEFVADCVREYQERYGSRFAFGSVQMRPEVWTRMALRTLAMAYKGREKDLVFPNGCCSQGMGCSINCFYALVTERMILPLPEEGLEVPRAQPQVPSAEPVAVPCVEDE